jgi:hypothetical protein
VISAVVVTALVGGGVTPTGAAIFDSDDWAELKMNPGRPYNAVGFLNNGCTASLIDKDHILAAAHCFTLPDHGGWQTRLRFYPNFHPDRIANNLLPALLDDHPPRADVARAVVATRVDWDMEEEGNDWGIARLENWKDTGGVDLTPMPLLNVALPDGDKLEQPGYARHLLPIDPYHTWDTNCGDPKWPDAEGKEGGWYLRRGRTPRINGQLEQHWCNVRWTWGQIRTNCWIRSEQEGAIRHNCDTSGGNSGSPILYRHSGDLYAVGVTGGGGGIPTFRKKAAEQNQSASYEPNKNDFGLLNYAAGAERFIEAPRYASNVALARRWDGAPATAVFGIDADLNRVVFRYREGGSTPDHTAPFSRWRSLGTPGSGAATRIAACDQTGSGPRPRLFALVGGVLYTRDASDPPGGLKVPSAKSKGWEPFALPAGVDAAADVDTANDSATRCQVFIVAQDGSAYTRRMISDQSWSGWEMVSAGTYKRVTAQKTLVAPLPGSRARPREVLLAMMIDTGGQLWRSANGGHGWSNASPVTPPGGVTAWLDADLGYDEQGNGRLWASNGGESLYYQNISVGAVWSKLATRLWAPLAPDVDKNGTPDPQPPPLLRSITASRWMEHRPGTTSPVVFATDEAGNVYFIEYWRGSGNRKARAKPGWITQWKSFYSQRIPY